MIKMLLVSQKHIFIDNRPASLCVTMRERYSAMRGKMEYKRFLWTYHIIGNKFLRWPL